MEEQNLEKGTVGSSETLTSFIQPHGVTFQKTSIPSVYHIITMPSTYPRSNKQRHLLNYLQTPDKTHTASITKTLIRSVIQTNKTTIYSTNNHWCAKMKILLRRLNFLTLKIVNIIIVITNLLYEELR
jgi:hypothetical protein